MTDPIVWTHYHELKAEIKAQRQLILDLAELVSEALQQQSEEGNPGTHNKIAALRTAIAQARQVSGQDKE